ncbi:MAG: hydroxyisourate hydrolase [Pyrinomonadaceae bacterium]
MSLITTHVLDISKGRPASGVPVVLDVQSAEHKWKMVAQGVTDKDGRLKNLLPEDAPLGEGVYRLTFDTSAYFASQDVSSFYPEVNVVFHIGDAAQHYHVPLLLSPYGYSTYRGS